ncbi:glycosyltransferase [Tripterygium wilfordii]|uniref:Glycosyltransferase n=1 Tax=Tripterygium wilfordii TaxID=458696 RepID=A0A7J7BX39_TRIWF|nr:probable glycosyltransferase At5g03795 [Tripterygium wilfordii]KAF5726187.1 glycosyltransferase [Tripterygium wilfordii]
MDQEFRLLGSSGTRRLLLIIGTILALVVVVQYFEFPYGIDVSSLFSVGNVRGFSSSSEELGNKTIDNVVEASNTKKEATQGGQLQESKLDYASKSNKNLNSSFVYNVSAVPQEDIEAEKNKTLGIAAKDDNSSIGSFGVDVTSTLGGNGSLNIGLTDVPPIASPARDSSSDKGFTSDTILGSAVIPRSSDTLSVGKDAADKLNMGEKPELFLSNYSTSGKVSSMTGVPLGQENKPKTLKGAGPPSIVFPISEMNHMLLQSHASSKSVTSQWPSKVDKEILSARSQIENAPHKKKSDGIYAPVYRNATMFKRSYELMEKMLKVYIYGDGEKPIFHDPILKGIYASEGWFMMLMEANKRFVTKETEKAHLFYFPFSSRKLELTLYNRKSYRRDKLIEYMKVYVDMIAAKYPFWNRTGGADHFLAACHDWAPAETRGQLLNCIRVLCNSDIEVGFRIGQDVSLPETYVRWAQNPLNHLGGNPPSQRPILAFFAGNLHGYVRPILLEYWKNDTDMKIFGPMPHVKGNTNYIEHMKTSKYCICARGYEVNSPRVVEAIFYDCVPVIISDNYVPPLFEVLNWESFAVFVLEKDIPNLKNVLLSISEEMYLEMHKRVKKVQKHFLWHVEPVKYDLFHMILHSVWYNRVFRI